VAVLLPFHLFHVMVFIVALVAGAVAALSGFGIGSLLTPLLATAMGMKAAVAAVSIPHFVATAVRLWGLRQYVDRRVLIHFGICSAAGGLLGALLQSRANSPSLSLVFGLLLIFAGISGLAGWTDRMHFQRGTAWIAGALSGLFGGLVGNQGGIRSAALMSFQLPKESLVATATATGILVDIARMPVYIAVQPQALLSAWLVIVLALAGCLAGTFWGVRLLELIPARRYKQMLSLFICALGIFVISRV
jgi:uncharacterized membrane protein YfcA